jgi:DNA repair ATPase RecN
MFNTKKSYFKKKLEGVKKMLWDYEFKKFKLLELREDVRREYDRAIEKADALQKQIENSDNKEETIKVLKEQKEETDKYIEYKASQLKTFGQQISGTDPEQEPSIQASIDGLHELDKMLRDYIKEI